MVNADCQPLFFLAMTTPFINATLRRFSGTACNKTNGQGYGRAVSLRVICKHNMLSVPMLTTLTSMVSPGPNSGSFLDLSMAAACSASKVCSSTRISLERKARRWKHHLAEGRLAYL